jgi:hypothetical protein
MTFVLALEACDGAITTFTSPMPWQPGTVTPTVNGRMRTIDFVVLGNTQVKFVEPPGYDDVVGFFLTPVAT